MRLLSLPWHLSRSWSPPRPIRQNTPSTPISSPPPAWLRYSSSSIAFSSAASEPIPLEIDGRPNYNLGPVKFATVARDVLGHRRHSPSGLWIALRTGLSGAQFRSAVDHVRPAAAAAHVGGDFRVRRQRADRDVVLCRAADLPGAARRRSGALVRGARLQFLHRDCRHRLSARHHAIEGIRRAGMVRRSVADDRLGHLSPGVPGDDHEAQRAAHLRRQLVLSRLHRHDRGAAHRQQSGDSGVDVLARSPTSSGPACRMR